MRPRPALALLLLVLVLAAFALGPGRSLIPGMDGIPVPSDAVPAGAHGPSGLLIRLNVDYDQGPDHGFGRHTADYLVDGTVIRWTNAGAACEPGMSCGVLERNTLTAAGLVALRALLAKDADLLTRPATIEPQIVPGQSTTGRPNMINTFVLEQPDGSRYTVRAPSASSYDAAAWAPDPAIQRLNALAKDLTDPAALLGAGGLVNPAWEPFQPAKMAVFISISPAPSQEDPTPIVDAQGIVSIPFGGPKYHRGRHSSSIECPTWTAGAGPDRRAAARRRRRRADRRPRLVAVDRVLDPDVSGGVPGSARPLALTLLPFLAVLGGVRNVETAATIDAVPTDR